jgi:hypothetical protein
LNPTTLAYNAVTGATLWTAVDTARGNGSLVAASPGGSAVFITVAEITSETQSNYRTIAYSASNGTQLWAQNFSINNAGTPAALVVSPDGSKVFVTGGAGGQAGAASTDEYGTVAYNAATGAQLWNALYKGPGSGGSATDLAVSPDGSKVVVTGSDTSALVTHQNLQYATLAYNSGTGAQVWLARFGDAALGDSSACATAVSPDGPKVFVTGESLLRLTTLAYHS